GGTSRWSLARHRQVAARTASPGRDPVSPPELTGDAPVVDVAHPLEIVVLSIIGNEADARILDGGDCFPRQGHHAHEPLARQSRLHDGIAPVTASHGMGMVLNLRE